MEIKINIVVLQKDSFYGLKAGSKIHYLSLDGYVDTMLCEKYLNCKLIDYQNIAIKYNAILAKNEITPIFLNSEDIQKFIDEWVYPQLVMNQLVKNN